MMNFETWLAPAVKTTPGDPASRACSNMAAAVSGFTMKPAASWSATESGIGMHIIASLIAWVAQVPEPVGGATKLTR